jgi:hypothetical protein
MSMCPFISKHSPYGRSSRVLLVLAATLAALCGVGPHTATSASTGLVAAYSFDEGSGRAVADASGNGNAGTLFGTIWAPGRFGYGLSFDGADDRVALPALGTFYDTGFTLEAWVRKRTAKKDVAVLGAWDWTRAGGPMLWVDHVAGHHQLTVGAEPSNYLDSGAPPTVEEWQHVAARFDGQVARFYLNGAEVGSREFSGDVGDTQTWLVGAYGGASPSGFFDGVIDEVRVYDRALGAEEVRADMDTSIGVPDTGAPSAPGSPGVQGVTEDAITLGWTAASDEIAVTGYTLYRDGVPIGSTPTTSYTVSGLACGTDHALDVEAFDAAGNISARAGTVASTAACDLSTPPAGLVAAYGFDEGGGGTRGPCGNWTPATLEAAYAAQLDAFCAEVHRCPAAGDRADALRRVVGLGDAAQGRARPRHPA